MDLSPKPWDWAEKLRACEYAGEVVIPEDDLPKVAASVRRDLFSPRRSHETARCLLVLAINCMYYRHDEQGFWIHFCDLMQLKDIVGTEDWLGRMLEVELLDLRLQGEPRSGPFRYVSPLREQCGITRREIPRFAQLLTRFSEQYGWDGLLFIERHRFNQFVKAELQEGHLSRFLYEDQGWAFSRDVARSVSQYQRGVITVQELERLPGYRTQFFTELFAELGDRPGPGTSSATKPPLPRLIFLPDFRQIALSFDQKAVNEGAYQFKNAVVRRTPMVWDSAISFGESISGQRRDSDATWSEWSIAGWLPKDGMAALFHANRGYLPSGQRIPPGHYYMLAPCSASPPQDLVVSSYGMVDLPFAELEYDAWLITIDASMDLERLGIQQKSPERIQDLITWAPDAIRLPGAFDLEQVFVTKMPDVVLARPELFTSGAVGLFLQCGTETKRIKVSVDRPRVSLDGLGVRPGSCGRVWAEPISRIREFSGLETVGDLPFCFLPECEIEWPEGLFSEYAEPEVRLKTQVELIALDLEDATRIDSAGCRWRLRPETTLVQGHLRHRDVEIPLARPIFRASLITWGKERIPFVTREDVEDGIGLVAHGIPGETVVISVANGHTEVLLSSPGTFNEAGECRFTTYTIRDALSRYRSPVGRFLIAGGGVRIETSTCFLDCADLTEWIVKAELDSKPPWWTVLPEHLRGVLSLLLRIKNEAPQEVPNPAGVNVLPAPLKAFLDLVRVAAVIIDGGVLAENPNFSEERILDSLEESHPEAAASLRWFSRARDFFRGKQISNRIGSEALLEEGSRLIWSPEFPRWKQRFAELRHHLKDDEEAIPLVDEWRRDAESGYYAKYRSSVGRQNNGRELTHAWIRYRSGHFPGAVIAAEGLIKTAGSPIVDLAAIVLRVSWMRLGLCRSQPEVQVSSTNRRLSAAYHDLEQILDFCEQGVGAVVPSAQHLAPFLSVLPLMEIDRKALRMFCSSPEPLEREGEDDWLACYFRLLIAIRVGPSERVGRLAIDMHALIDAIPPSPDKQFIMEIVEKYT